MSMPADVWDVWNRGHTPRYPHEKVIQYCFRHFPQGSDRQGVKALDLGCGCGVHSVFLASEGFDVTAIDGSEVGVATTRQKLDAAGLAALVRVESAAALDFPPANFDLIISVGVFDAAGPAVARKAVERCRHVLRPRGRGLFLFASDGDYRVTGPNPLGLHGFTRQEVDEMFSYQFTTVWMDRYITTYEGGRLEQNDWLITLER